MTNPKTSFARARIRAACPAPVASGRVIFRSVCAVPLTATKEGSNQEKHAHERDDPKNPQNDIKHVSLSGGSTYDVAYHK